MPAGNALTGAASPQRSERSCGAAGRDTAPAMPEGLLPALDRLHLRAGQEAPSKKVWRRHEFRGLWFAGLSVHCFCSLSQQITFW